MVFYVARAPPTAGFFSGQWLERTLGRAQDWASVAACLDLPRECVAVQPWTLSIRLPTVAAWLAAVDPEGEPQQGAPG